MNTNPAFMSQADLQAWQEDMTIQYLPSLERLVEVGRGHSGQPHHIRCILLAIYNSSDWPLDLGRLQALDHELQIDALNVIRWKTLSDREPHTHLADGDRIMLSFWKRERPDDFPPENGAV